MFCACVRGKKCVVMTFAMMTLYLVVLGLPLMVAGHWLFRVWFVNGVSCKSKVRLDGKTVIITGANTGIGKETAIALARRGGRIIIGCRSVQRGEKACEEIREKSGNDDVIFRQLDLASCKSIRTFAKQILAEEREINILVNNAGIMYVPYELTEDGYESQFGVNHLGHFLLTNLILDRIKESAPSRIVIVSSTAHFYGSLDFDNMMWTRKSYSAGLAYTRSKLANIMFARELAKRLSESGVTVCALHPGTIYTEIARYFFTGYLVPLIPFAHVMMWLFAKTAKQGAQTSIHCAVATEVEGVSGKYWDTCAVKRSSMNEEDCQRLWEYSADLVGLDNN